MADLSMRDLDFLADQANHGESVYVNRPPIDARPPRQEAPPSNVESEKMLLAAIVRKPSIISESNLTRDHFHSDRNRAIFGAVATLATNGDAVDMVTIGEQLKRQNQLGSIVKAHDITDVCSGVSSAGHETHLRIVRECYARRQLLYLSTDLSRDVTTADGCHPDAIAAFRDRLDSIRDTIAGTVRKRVNRLNYMDATSFMAAQEDHRFAIRYMLVKGQPCIVGGPKKALKTSLMLDAGISLATGNKFLGKFTVDAPGRVLFISGESGITTLQETARRIGDAKGIDVSSINMLWSTSIPKLSRAADVEGLRQVIIDEGIEYLILDPLYLALLAGSEKPRSASNLFDIGETLLPLSEIGTETGCTLILLHHLRKATTNGSDAPPGLEDLAFAGIQEWARQWILIGRREAYEPGTGTHHLWLESGGSAGHSSAYAIDVNEGTVDEDLKGRHWHVDVQSAAAVRKDDAQSRADEKAARKEQDRLADQHRNTERILAHLRGRPDGDTKNQIRERLGVSGGRISILLENMLADGIIEEIKVHAGNQKRAGYRLKEKQPDQPDQPDLSGPSPASLGQPWPGPDNHPLRGCPSVRSDYSDPDIEGISYEGEGQADGMTDDTTPYSNIGASSNSIF